MTCPSCGNQTPDQAEHCPSCGSRLVAAAQPASPPPWGAPSGQGAPPPWDAPSGQGAPVGQGVPVGQGAPPVPPSGYPSFPPADATGWGGAPAEQVPYGGAPPSYGGGSYGPPPSFGASPYQQFPQDSGWGGQGGGGPSLAGWWRRVGATVIDGIIVGIFAVIGLAIGGRALEYIVGFLLGLAYTSYLLVTRGQTVGMMAVSTKCVVESTGANLAPGPAIGRYVLGEVLAVTVIGGLLDIFWPLWDAKNQTLHDKVVGSLVVMA